MHKSFIRVFSTVCICMMLLMNTSCAKQEQSTMKAKQSAWIEIKVVYLNVEGGFYGLVTKDGKKLLPMNLAKEYHIEDTVLKIKGDEIEGMATIQQWGIPYKLTGVQLVKLGKKKHSNEY